MNYYSASANAVLIVTAGVLAYAAWADLRAFKIRNELIIVLAGLFVVHAFLSGYWRTAYWNLLIALIVFLGMLPFYMRRGMGGGDIKLLTVSFLWVGYSCALPFSLFLLVFAGIHAAIAKSVRVGAFGARGRWINIVAADGKRVPFAPAIAASLIGTFVLGCLDAPKVH